MRGWRSKLVFMLVVYFAGFATAIYTLAPAPDDNDKSACNYAAVRSSFKSDQFAKSVNTGLHKCIDLGKDAAKDLAGFIRQKVDEVQAKPKK